MIYNCFTEKNLLTLYFLNNMKYILLIVGICTLFACAAPKAPITKSVEAKKKEAYKDVKISKTPRTPTYMPKDVITPVPVSPEFPENKPLDTREY
jgi:hypothetical protein